MKEPMTKEEAYAHANLNGLVAMSRSHVERGRAVKAVHAVAIEQHRRDQAEVGELREALSNVLTNYIQAPAGTIAAEYVVELRKRFGLEDNNG